MNTFSDSTTTIDPINLLSHKRFDILAKYVYARYKELNLESNWGIDLYEEHIRVFNGFVENDGEGKYGNENFIEVYNTILDSIKVGGFDKNISSVPVGRNQVILDGAHRLAACIFYQSDILIKNMDNDAPEYNYEYFLKNGLKRKWADAIAIEYCRVESNTFVPVIYPSAQGYDSELKAILSKYSDIFYSKEVYLTGDGPLNLIRQIYISEPWLGSYSDGYSGAQNKTFGCFQKEGPVRVFLVKSDLESMLKAKNEIRDLFGISNHSVHINDTHDESLDLCNILFNENSIHFINNSKVANFKWFQNLLNEYMIFIKNNNIDSDYLCVDGSSVMAAYGVREARDLDYLHHGYDDVESGYKEIGSHNHSADLYPCPLDDIIFNPSNHFYYNGLKFASLNILKDMKKRRGEDKDFQDLNLINEFLSGIKPKKTFKDFMAFLNPRFWHVKARFMALKIRFYLFKLLKYFK